MKSPISLNRCDTWVFAGAIFGGLLWPVQAQQPVANLGTLSCTLDPGTAKPFGVERELSCSFDPVVGVKANFVGIVKRLGAQSPGQRKIVLVWSVLAPSMETSLSDLEGRYVGDLDAERRDGAHGLIGGTEGKIELKPLTVNPGLGENAALSVLELELAAMKV